MKRMFILSVVLIPFFCASLAFSQQPQKNSYDYGKYGAQSFPARKGSVDWGLALSGGGPRSALFSIGAMKALYDRGYLDKLDVISSTSGGSYASYWLLTSYDPSRRNEKFGAARFDNSKFLQQICFLQNEDKSNFLPILRSLGALPTGDKRFKKYEDAIFNSFGYEPTYTEKKYPRETKLDFLNSSIDAGDVPYFIINTTIGVKQVDVEKKEWLELGIDKKEWLELAKVFEITPKYRGNVRLKFQDWAGKDNESSKNENYNEDAPWTLSKSVATSGIPSFLFASRGIKHIGEKERLMWDGGQAENLAAFGLISRGISNVIIVDSEQDAGYKFEAYTELQERLEKIGVSFCVPEIDAFLKKPHCLCREGLRPKSGKQKKWSSPVSVGKAKSIDDGGVRIDSNIYYVKMSDPEAVLPAEWFLDDKIFDKGVEYAIEREKQRCPNDGKVCKCEGISLNLLDVEERKAFYTYRVREYSEWLNGLRPWNGFKDFKAWVSILPFKVVGKAIPFCSYNFPHTTTVELTFFANQLEAFVGLGYLQTMELKEVPQK